MSGTLIVFSKDELKELIKSSIAEALAEKQEPVTQDPPIIYRTRKYVKDLLHTTYPTLQKYTESGLLNGIYFGRRVMYIESELNLALPRLKCIQAQRSRKQNTAA